MDFQTAVKTCLNKYAVFEGRARRAEYWWFVLFNLIVGFVLGFIGGLIGLAWLGQLLSLAVVIPGIAAGARRLHDINRSGWWLLLAVVPLANILLIVWLATPGDNGPNQYGNDPIKG